MAIEPAGQIAQRWMGEIALEPAPQARDMGEIGGFAIETVEPDEGAKYAGIALGADDGIGRVEGGGIERGKGREIALDQGASERGGTSRRASSMSDTRSKTMGAWTASWKSSSPQARTPGRSASSIRLSM